MALPLHRLILPTFIVGLAASAVACTAPQTQGEESASTVSDISGSSCSVSRDEIIASASAKRQRAIERGFQWLDDNVPYSQSASHEGYRTDCSGFVSMCWELGKSGTTSTFYSGDSNEDLGSWDELIPADAMVKKGHMMMFLAWNDSAKSGACVLEQSSTKNDMQFRVRNVASLKKEGYKPIRATKLAADTGGATDSAFDDGTTPKPKPTPTDEEPLPTDDETCTPASALMVCSQAKLFGGATCGFFDDGCGGVIDCTNTPGFGCAANEVCQDTQCVCVPMTATEACDAANTTAGIQCGQVDDGCGGKVTCDGVRGFGCEDGATCNTASNRCEDPKAPAKEPEDQDDLEDAPKGDKGDDKEPPAKPQQKQSRDEAQSKSGPKAASSGCSASPVDAGRSDAIVILGAIVAAAGLRRRSRKQ